MTEPNNPVRDLTLVLVAFLLHNTEEALTIPGMRPLAQAKLEGVFGSAVSLPSAGQYSVALPALTFLAFLVWLMALYWPSLSYAIVVLQATMALNVVNHVAGSWWFGGYAPGLITAVLVESVVSVVVYQRLRRAKWMSRRQWLLLPLLAILSHGPILYGGLLALG